MTKRIPATVFLIAAALLLTSCQTIGYGSKQHNNSSVVEYLYSDRKAPPQVPSIPNLTLPLKVAIAFVPGRDNSILDEPFRMELADRVAREFETQPFVKEIQRIPGSYLTPKGGFENLDQVRTMYGTDVVALISYDQVQHTDEGMLSVLYWTLVGLYVVNGEKNDTSTMLDAAVFDIPSRKMLFRAPGISHVKGEATPINLSEKRRLDSRKGFEEAAGLMTGNLKKELDAFKEKVKKQPEQYKVIQSSEYRGGGATDLPSAFLLLALTGFALLCGKRGLRA